jgi:VanZ family protein
VRHRTLAWLPALVWAGVIFALSGRPALPTPRLFPGFDKAAHFGAYALLGFLLARGAAASRLGPGWVLAIGLLYGASDEYHQSFVPGRSVEAGDWVADALGVAAGLWIHRKRNARRTELSSDGVEAY